MCSNQEEWRYVDGFNNNYLVSSEGRFFDNATNKYLKNYPFKTVSGQKLKVYFQVGESFRLMDVAKCVAETFIGKSDNQTVDFKDGNSLNCSVENLYYRDYKSSDERQLKYTNDEYIEQWIQKYRDKYPQDEFVDDIFIGLELKQKLLSNIKNGMARTQHFRYMLERIHNKYGKLQLKEFIFVNDIKEMEDSLTADRYDDIEYFDVYEVLKDGIDTILTPKQRMVIKLRWGILTDDEIQKYVNEYGIPTGKEGAFFTMEVVAQILGVGRERIRQIEEKSFWKLKRRLLSHKKLQNIRGENNVIK